MRIDPFDYTVWAICLLLVAAIAGLVWGGNQRGITIISTIPPDGGQLGVKGPLVVQFLQPIDSEGIQGMFSIEPDVSGKSIVRDDQLLFFPDQALIPNSKYIATLRAGIIAQNGRRVKREYSWSFSVRDPGIVYLGYDDNELYYVPLSGGESELLTNTAGAIFDFAPSKVGSQIAFSVINEEKGFDIWVMDREAGSHQILVECGLDRCATPAWSPDGTQLAYSRTEAGLGPNEPYGSPKIWLADTHTGETFRLYSDTQKIGYGPGWSPNGQKLAYSDGINNQIVVLDIETGDEFFIPTRSGRIGSWSPDSSQLVYSDFLNTESGTVEVINMVDFETQDILNFLGYRPNENSYNSPKWSPTGKWIAARAKANPTDIHYELMILEADAAYGYVLADDPNYAYLNHSFDPTGRYLVYQRTQLGVAYSIPEILIIDIQSNQTFLTVANASFPAWLP